MNGNQTAHHDAVSELENLAYTALQSGEKATIHELQYVTSAGCLEIQVVGNPLEASGVTISIHPGDIENPYVALTYTEHDNLDSFEISDARTKGENLFFALETLSEIANDSEILPAEISIVRNLQRFIGAATQVIDGGDVKATTADRMLITGMAKFLVLNNATGVQHLQELSGVLDDGLEIRITGTQHKPTNGHPAINPESQYPILQIDLKDHNDKINVQYLRLATQLIECSSSAFLADDKAADSMDKFDEHNNRIQNLKPADGIDSTASVIDRATIERLTTAVAALIIEIELDKA